MTSFFDVVAASQVQLRGRLSTDLRQLAFDLSNREDFEGSLRLAEVQHDLDSSLFIHSVRLTLETEKEHAWRV